MKEMETKTLRMKWAEGSVQNGDRRAGSVFQSCRFSYRSQTDLRFQAAWPSQADPLSAGLPLLAQTVKNLLANAGDPGSIPAWGRRPGGGRGHPLKYPCLENAMDRGAWRAYTPWGGEESDTTERLTHTHTHTHTHTFPPACVSISPKDSSRGRNGNQDTKDEAS